MTYLTGQQLTTKAWRRGEVLSPEVIHKPHKGRISNWEKRWWRNPGGTQGEYIVGLYVDHPVFRGQRGHTSFVVKEELMGDGSIEIETLNSKYTLLSTPATRKRSHETTSETGEDNRLEIYVL